MSVLSKLAVSLPETAGHPRAYSWALPLLESPKTQASFLHCHLPPTSLAQSQSAASAAAAASLSPVGGLFGRLKQLVWPPGLESNGLGSLAKQMSGAWSLRNTF